MKLGGKSTGEVINTNYRYSVYYPAGQENLMVGMLAVYTDGLDSTPEIVKAKPNRFIIFRAGHDQQYGTVK